MTEQVRGWWNSQLILSTICFDKSPFKAIAVHGKVLGMGKKKMSKSQGNIISPKEIIEKYNRDYLRYYLVTNSRGEDFECDDTAFKDIHRLFNVLWNAFNYALIYLDLDLSSAEKLDAKQLKAEDRWIASKVNSLAGTVLEAYNSYNFFKANAAIEQFVLEELSRTYIKLVRERAEEKAVSKTMAYVLDKLLRMLAPITPHIADYLYQASREEKMPMSVHLLSLPEPDKKLVDKKLEEEFERAKQVTQAVLSLREENKLRRRWPLKGLIIVSKTGKELSKVREVIASSCNVQKVLLDKKKPRKGKLVEKEAAGVKVFLNIEADAELKENWELQELRRKIQKAEDFLFKARVFGKAQGSN